MPDGCLPVGLSLGEWSVETRWCAHSTELLWSGGFTWERGSIASTRRIVVSCRPSVAEDVANPDHAAAVIAATAAPAATGNPATADRPVGCANSVWFCELSVCTERGAVVWRLR
jgi:hypothetical protein